MCTYLSVWRSHNRLYTPVDCPPSGNTRRLWPAASYTRHRRSSAGDTRSPAPSGPPVSAGCPADTQRTWSRISCRQNTAKHRSDGTRSVSVNDMKPCKCWNTKDWLEEVVFAVDTVASTEAFVGQLRLTVAAFQTLLCHCRSKTFRIKRSTMCWLQPAQTGISARKKTNKESG